jgi:hypothetical protein
LIDWGHTPLRVPNEPYFSKIITQYFGVGERYMNVNKSWAAASGGVSLKSFSGLV